MNLPDSLIKALARRKCSVVEENGQFRLTGAVMRLPAEVCTELLRLQVKGVPFAKAPVKPKERDFQRQQPLEVPRIDVDALLAPFGGLFEAAKQERLPLGVVQFSAWETTQNLNRAVCLAEMALRQESVHPSPYIRCMALARVEQLARMAKASGFGDIGG